MLQVTTPQYTGQLAVTQNSARLRRRSRVQYRASLQLLCTMGSPYLHSFCAGVLTLGMWYNISCSAAVQH